MLPQKPEKIEKLDLAKWAEYDKALEKKQYPFSIRFRMLELQQDIEQTKYDIAFHEALAKERETKWTEEASKINKDIIAMSQRILKDLIRRAQEL